MPLRFYSHIQMTHCLNFHYFCVPFFRCQSPEPYATTPLIRDVFLGPAGTPMPPNIPLSPGQSPLPSKPGSEDSSSRSEHSSSNKSHNLDSHGSEKGGFNYL